MELYLSMAQAEENQVHYPEDYAARDDDKYNYVSEYETCPVNRH